MPTSSKRVQVLLGPKVLEQVEKLSEWEGVSLSRTCALLIREALMNRGLHFDPMLRDNMPDGWQAGTKPVEAEPVQETNDPDEETLRLLKKFKALQDAGLL